MEGEPLAVGPLRLDRPVGRDGDVVVDVTRVEPTLFCALSLEHRAGFPDLDRGAHLLNRRDGAPGCHAVGVRRDDLKTWNLREGLDEHEQRKLPGEGHLDHETWAIENGPLRPELTERYR